MTPHIVVVGAGFSGALTAVNLLRHAGARPLRVTLLNRSGRMARGLAYGTASAGHVLNVPAGNMSALADAPDDFLHYCRWANPRVQASSFVSRRLYGSYLEALLDAAEHGIAPGVELVQMTGEAVDVVATDTGVEISLAGGQRLLANQVVFAFGHFASRTPPALADLRGTISYLHDPWAGAALERIAPDVPVLLIGTGLTALDVTTALHRQGHRDAPVWMLSRRGLMPQPHRETRGSFPRGETTSLVSDMGHTARRYLHALRKAIRGHEADGGDWRDVVGALRPHTPMLWQRLDEQERKRFLRHLQPFWDTARHRCAPAAYEDLMRWTRDGTVRRVAGRITGWRHASAGGIEVSLATRSAGAAMALHVGMVINCTGPEADLDRVDTPLVRRLLQRGMARPDPCHVGIGVDRHGALLDANGQAAERLFYIGPLLRGRDWEATAVPELRQHAHRLALHLLEIQGFPQSMPVMAPGASP